MGEKGYVTSILFFQRENYDRIYCCGPDSMMKAIAAVLSKDRNIVCEVSLENLMACGIGACLVLYC